MSDRPDPAGGKDKRGRKVRVELRKNISNVRRKRDWADAAYHNEQGDVRRGDESLASENVRAKGSLSRKRTIIEDAPPSDSAL